MATYSQLIGSSFTDVVVPFTTNNGLGETDTCTETLTGYTLELTKFTCTAILSSLDNTYIGASMDKLIWDMGDGTYLTGVTVEKQYRYPGEYEIKTIFTDQNGVTHKNTLSQKIKVYNYVPDALIWYTEAITDELGGRPEQVKAGRHSEDLTILRTNSWQSWDAVKEDDGYFINLYSSGSKSSPLTTEQYWADADIHLTPTWRFVQNKNSYVPISRVQTDNNFIYVKKQGNTLIQTDGTDSDSFFAGTSGSVTVNYIDDNPNRLTSARPDDGNNTNDSAYVSESTGDTGFEDRDIILYASIDTSKLPLVKEDENLINYDIFKQNYFQFYETQKVGLPIKVKYNYPDHLSITANGLGDFPINSTKFINSPMALTVRTVDEYENSVLSRDLVPLSSRWHAPTQAFSGGDITTDTLTAQGFVSLYLSGSDSTFRRVETPFASQEDFKVWDVGTIYPENEQNKYIRVVIAEKDGTMQPPVTNRTVKILFSQLVEEQQAELITTDIRDHVSGHGRARDWITTSGERYYGYITPGSTYKDLSSVDMSLQDVTESFTTPGSWLLFSNLKLPEDSVNKELKYRYFAHTLVDPPLTFGTEVLYYYITNPTNDMMWQVKPVYFREYSYGEDGMTQTYTPPISTQTPGNSGMYGIAVDKDGNMLAVDGDTDKIIRYYRNRTLRSEMSIRDLLPEETRGNHYPDNPNMYGYTPSSISLDKNNDYWVTLYDTVSTIKISGETDEIIASAIPNENDMLVDVRSTNPNDKWTADPEYRLNQVNGRPGEYGESLIVPATVETCVNNDIVVTYTNPLCSFICRYNSTGELLYKYEPPKNRYFTGDVVVDVSDHTWAITESTGLNEDGTIDHSPPRSMIHSFDEELTVRLSVSSLAGTKFQDMQQPAPHVREEKTFLVNMQQDFDYIRQRYYERSFLIDGFGEQENPMVTVYEGNQYTFVNLFHNNGKHPIRFQELTESDYALPLSTNPVDYKIDGAVMSDSISGVGTDSVTIEITDETPGKFLLIDENFQETIKLLIKVIPKPVINARATETFDIINNAGFIVPDNNNHIWFSWGNRYCSRFNVGLESVDTTVAVGSAYEDPRFDPLSADMLERRDNADRRSAIEGISMDTANNLLIIHNHDKRIYALNSDTPTVSAYIEIPTYQQPYESFTWVESLCNDIRASDDDFLLYPDTYLTEEQIKVFLKNSHFTGTQEQLQAALQNYKNDDTKWRTCHGANPVSATGFEEELCGYGDWTGYRWINKFDPRPVASDATTGYISVTGSSEEFNLILEQGVHDIMKVNEDKDFAGVIRSYMQQPSLRENTKLYDSLMNTVFGTTDSGPFSLGKRIYERISNYVENHTDIDTCTIQSLHGLAALVNYELKNTGYPMPAELQRLTDMLSINLNRLKGIKTGTVTDFEKHGNWEQKADGVNLGSEIMFIFDWHAGWSYQTGDYTYYRSEYYECVSPNKGNQPVHLQHSEHWKHWPGGEVKTTHMLDINRLYKGKTPEWREEYYNNQTTKIKLVQNLKVEIDKKIVLHEEHTGRYNLVTPVAISVEDARDFKVTIVDQEYFRIENNNMSRLSEEYMAAINVEPIYTISNDVVTIMNRPIDNNSTILLFRNRTYRFEIDSFNHPIIITTAPGASAELAGDYVSGQHTEYGKIIIKTDDHPIYGQVVPEKLYYQSTTDPNISGTIVIQDIKDVPGYDSKFNGLTTYNLNMSVSSHEQLDKLGWGMTFPETGNAWQYYSIYEYNEPVEENYNYSNSVIDWYSPNTTLTFSELEEMGVEGWSGDNGFVDTLYEKVIRDGLDMFDGFDSIK